jgi:drug/metabolite transporter (DMT)-like permease
LAYFLAIASAAFFGAADFIGGLAARRAATSVVVMVSGLAGIALLAVLIPVMPSSVVTPRDLGWGAAAGLAGGAGVGLLYRALAIGTMSVIAPTTAVCGVSIPVIAGIAFGERPSAATGAGIALALVAIVLVSQEQRQHRAPGAPRGFGPGIGLALLSGVAIGLFYLSLAETSPDAGLWPLLAARGASVGVFTVIAIAGRHPMRMAPPLLRLVIAGGVLDMVANALYLIATRGGPLSVVVTLSSLYPASTVILARMVLGERLSTLQIAGVLCAMVAVVLIVGAA